MSASGFLRTPDINKIDIMWAWFLLLIGIFGIALQLYARESWWEEFGYATNTWRTLERDEMMYAKYTDLRMLEGIYHSATIILFIGILYSLAGFFFSLVRFSPIAILFHALALVNIFAFNALCFKIWSTYAHIYS